MAQPEADHELARRLRAALDGAPPPSDLDMLIDEARADARREVKRLLTGAMTESMLAQIEARLAPPPAPAPTPPPAPAAQRGPDRTANQPGVYVYGVVPAIAELPEGLRGIDPISRPRLLRHGDLAAVVSKVSLSEFEEERLREHLSDMAWVEATARAHELVLEMVGEVTTLIPMRMCSVYRTEGGVSEMLARESTPLSEALDHLKGKTEWGLKVFAEPQPPPGTGTAEAGEQAESGTDYMRQRRSERDARFTVDERLNEACTAIHDELSAVAVDSLTAPLQRPEVSGHDGQMLLNGVYLVQSAEQPEFLNLVETLRAEYESLGLYLEPTGPWPAYNFVPGTIGAAW
jgi:hypothetical protein